MAVQSTVFVSYSHQDNTSKDALVRHLAPLKTNGLVDLWHDRKLMPGDEFKSEINNNIEEAQVICLLISANFLASKSCIEEAKRALELRKKRCTSVVPIILSPCGWTDFPELAQLLALPTDAKPISSFADQDDAWNSVYGGIKDVVERAQRM